MTSGLARELLGVFARPVPDPALSSDFLLAERERDVLEMLVRGVTCRRELVERLVGSEDTIPVHQGFAERPEPDASFSLSQHPW